MVTRANAGWLKRTYPGEPHNQVSHETIYRSLFQVARTQSGRGGLEAGPLEERTMHKDEVKGAGKAVAAPLTLLRRAQLVASYARLVRSTLARG
jgi:hypothetical protein